MFASQKDYGDIMKVFRKHRPTFPHLRPKTIKDSISRKNMVWCDDVIIQFKRYQRSRKKGEFTCSIDDINLEKMVSNKGKGSIVFDKWLDYLGTGRIVLSVSKSNTRAIDFYCKKGFEKVSEITWGKEKITGFIMKLDF